MAAARVPEERSWGEDFWERPGRSPVVVGEAAVASLRLEPAAPPTMVCVEEAAASGPEVMEVSKVLAGLGGVVEMAVLVAVAGSAVSVPVNVAVAEPSRSMEVAMEIPVAVAVVESSGVVMAVEEAVWPEVYSLNAEHSALSGR